MGPIPYFYESINRNAIIIKPKQPLLDWANAIFPGSPVTLESISEGTVYLVKERDSNEQIKKWLQKNFDEIFQNELNNWHTDEKDWPTKRTFKNFVEWFDVEIHSVVLDLEDDEVTKD